MTQRAIHFVHLWLDRNDLLDGRPVDDAEMLELTTRLFIEAEAEGFSGTEIAESWDEVHRSLAEFILRRHQAPNSKQ